MCKVLEFDEVEDQNRGHEDLQRRIDHLERVVMEYEATHGCFDPFGGDA